MGAISFSNVIFDQPIRRRRRLARLAIPTGIALWAAALVWLAVRLI